jgi:hypothetical protein
MSSEMIKAFTSGGGEVIGSPKLVTFTSEGGDIAGSAEWLLPAASHSLVG